MKNKLFKDLATGLIYRITHDNFDVWYKEVKSNNFRAKMGANSIWERKDQFKEKVKANIYQFVEPKKRLATILKAAIEQVNKQ